MNIISATHPAALKAARWIRNSNKIPDCESVVDQFEETFNCRVEHTYGYGITIEFKDDTDYTWFLLKWT